ncbi:MAG: diguanylate cyclase, partial [Bryobacteraceae bacterium]
MRRPLSGRSIAKAISVSTFALLGFAVPIKSSLEILITDSTGHFFVPVWTRQADKSSTTLSFYGCLISAWPSGSLQCAAAYGDSQNAKGSWDKSDLLAPSLHTRDSDAPPTTRVSGIVFDEGDRSHPRLAHLSSSRQFDAKSQKPRILDVMSAVPPILKDSAGQYSVPDQILAMNQLAHMMPVALLSEVPLGKSHPIGGRQRSPVTSVPSIPTSVRQMHHLTRAGGHPPVVVEGVVTGVTFTPQGFTVQDGRDGIYVVFRATQTEVGLGQRVRIWGTGDASGFSPIVMADRVEILSHGALPNPRRISAVEVDDGTLDNEYVEVRGIVRTATMTSDGGRTFGIMRLDTRPGSILLIVRAFEVSAEKYVDSVVRARGVVEVDFNVNRQALGLQVGIANIGDITIERSARLDPFGQPVTPIDSIKVFESKRDWSHRFRIRGGVTLQQRGEFVVVQDGNRGIRVDTKTDETLPVGTILDVAGFVSTKTDTPILTDAIIRSHKMSMTVKPLPQGAVDVLAGRSNWSLVSVPGILIESGQSPTGLTLLLDDHGAKFSAELRNGPQEQFKVAPGSQIQITGVCENFTGTLSRPEGFRLLLRTASDVKVLTSAPLSMNREFLIRSGVALTAVAILSAVWALMLRRRVRQQTSWIRTSLVKEKAAASHDSLTGLPNRRYFESSLAATLNDANIAGKRVALYYIDLIGFKRINDIMGHSVGDLVLQQVAQRLRGALDSAELLARIGGDEFAIIQPNALDDSASEGFAKRLFGTFRDAFVTAGSSIQVGASIGVTRYPIDGESVDEIKQNADTAMYHARRNATGFAFFDSSMATMMRRKAEIRQQLPGAVARGEFQPHFQPIVDLSTGLIVRFEALCRWNSPQLGSVPPLEFIPVAEETGHIDALGKLVLREACRQGCRWQIN